MSGEFLLGTETADKVRLAKIASKSSNKKCSDCLCSIKSVNQWASAVYGVFVCKDCAKLHGYLKANTKMKSVRCDTWSKAEVDRMAVMGNAFAKEVLEGDLKHGFRRPCDQTAKLWFMDKKYSELCYVSDSHKMKWKTYKDSFELHLQENDEMFRDKITAAPPPVRRAISQEIRRKNGVCRNDHPKAKGEKTSLIKKLVDVGLLGSQSPSSSSSAADGWTQGPLQPTTGSSHNKLQHPAPSVCDSRMVRSVSDWAVFPSPRQAVHDIDWPGQNIDREKKQSRETTSAWLGLDVADASCATPRDIDLSFICLHDD